MGMQDDDELAGLSDEERAALADDEDDDDAEILGKIAGGSDPADDDDDDDDNPDKADAPDEKTDAAPDAVAVPEAEAAVPSVETEYEAEFRAEFSSDRPEGMVDRIAKLEADTQELMTQFTDGVIDLSEFMAKKQVIDNEKLNLSIAEAQAQWAEKQNAETADQRWQWEQQRFFAQDKAKMYEDPIIMAALNASVKQLGADPANAQRPASFFLEEADRQIRKRFNLGAVTTKDPAPSRQPDLSKIPKTLAQLPAADISETGDVEFAYLDKLDGMALEMALRKMTPEQEARYLGAAA